MRTREQVKWDYVQQWLDKARKDLAAGEVLLKEEFEDYGTSGSTPSRLRRNLSKPFSFAIRSNFQRATIWLSSGSSSPR